MTEVLIPNIVVTEAQIVGCDREAGPPEAGHTQDLTPDLEVCLAQEQNLILQADHHHQVNTAATGRVIVSQHLITPLVMTTGTEAKENLHRVIRMPGLLN